MAAARQAWIKRYFGVTAVAFRPCFKALADNMCAYRALLVALLAWSRLCSGLAVTSNASSQTRVISPASGFMLAAGVTAPSEMCLTAVAGHVGLEACAEAIAAGDGQSQIMRRCCQCAV